MKETFLERPEVQKLGAQKVAILQELAEKAKGKQPMELLELLQKRNPDLKLPKILDYKYISKHDNNVVIIISGTVERLFKRFIK